MSLEVDGYLSLIDCSNTHNQVLFRKTEIMDGTVNNLDVLFEGVRFLSCPFDLRNPTIKKVPSSEFFENFDFDVESYGDCNVYMVENNDRSINYIIAGQAKYQYNKLPPEETNIACKKEEDPLFDDIDLLAKRIKNEEYPNVRASFEEKWDFIR